MLESKAVREKAGGGGDGVSGSDPRVIPGRRQPHAGVCMRECMFSVAMEPHSQDCQCICEGLSLLT